MKYRKKPVEVEVFHLTDLNYDTVINALNFMGETGDIHKKYQRLGFERPLDRYMNIVCTNKGIYINTLEGQMLASVGDYIIKGVNGEFYPCKPDIFKKTYELVE